MGANKEGVTAEPQTKIQGGDKDVVLDAPRCWPGNPLDHFTAGFVYLLLTSLQIILRQN